MVPTLPNVAEFVIMYFALRKIGCIPIASLVTHRFTEINQIVRLAQARCAVYPTSVREQGADARFAPIVDRVHPRTGNDYAYNSKVAADVALVEVAGGRLHDEVQAVRLVGAERRGFDDAVEGADDAGEHEAIVAASGVSMPDMDLSPPP